MFFHFSKIIWGIFMPSNVIGLILFAGIMMSRHFKRVSQNLLLVGAILFVLTGLSPLGYNLMHYWESLYPAPMQLPKKVDGVIVLGGSFELDLNSEHNAIMFNDSAERLITFASLSLQYPNAKLVFSGGSGSLTNTDHKEADYARLFLESLNFPIEKVIFEDRSRNTYENVIFSKELVQPNKDEVWLLVTSAFHMPRSIAVFQSHDWTVMPVPVDFRTGKAYYFWPLKTEIIENMKLFDAGIKETLGLITYKSTGKIK